jgi:hypothetical protein
MNQTMQYGALSALFPVHRYRIIIFIPAITGSEYDLMKHKNNRPVAEYKGRILSDLEILKFFTPWRQD